MCLHTSTIARNQMVISIRDHNITIYDWHTTQEGLKVGLLPHS